MTTTIAAITATLPRAEIAELVGWCAKSLPSKPENPLLAGLRLTVTDDELHVDAFDGDTHVSGFIGVTNCPDFTTIVSGRMFSDTLSKLAGATVTLTLDERTLSLKSGRATAKFRVLPHESYPTLPTPAPSLGQIDAADLAAAVDAVADFADDNPLSGRPELRAILLQVKSGMLWVCATDAYQMGRAIVPWPGPDGHVLVPAPVLADAVANMTGTLHLGWIDGVFTLGDVDHSTPEAHGHVTTRTVPGEPKDFARFFAPVEHPVVAYVDAAELGAIVKRSSSFLVDKAPLIVTVDSQGEIGVRGAGVADAEYEDACEATVTGESMTFGIRPAYLLAALASVDSALVRIGLIAPEKQIRFDPAESVGDGVSEVRSAIVMPVRSA